MVWPTWATGWFESLVVNQGWMFALTYAGGNLIQELEARKANKVPTIWFSYTTDPVVLFQLPSSFVYVSGLGLLSHA